MATLDECLRAIQRKCLDCCGGSREEVSACDLATCALYPYRLGERQVGLFADDTPPKNRPARSDMQAKLLG